MPRGAKKGENRGAGRPKGVQNKTTIEIRQMAQKYGEEAIMAAVHLMHNAVSEAARVAAINLLLDRGYGKSIQPQVHSGVIGTYDLSQVPDDALNQLDTIIRSVPLIGSDNE